MPRLASPSSHRAALLAAGAAVAALLGSCSAVDDDEAPPVATGPATTDSAEPAGPAVTRYVALGDSFAALGPTDAPTSGPPGCLRSTRNYPALLAERVRVAEFVDATCGGARTVDMTSAQIAQTPPQFDALTPDTDLVTLSIGGNDIGFGAIAGCIARVTGPPVGAPCRDRLDAEVSRDLDGLGGRLDAVHAGIDERSPGARVVVTAYLPLVPADMVPADGVPTDMVPADGGCEFLAGVSPGDVSWARDVTDRVNRAVADAADRAGAQVVLPGDADDRHACAPADARYTDFTGVDTGSHPMHPTAVGQRAMAAAVAGVL